MGISIEISQVSKKLVANQALINFSSIFEAELMHGIIGPHGAGKTTLFRHIVGLLNPDKGTITYLEDNNIVPLSKIRTRIAYMPQQQSLYADLSIAEHLLFFKEMYCVSNNDFKSKQEKLLEITNLGKFADRPAGKLSGGMYKKLGLMCALMSSPKVLLLDEPTNGVDPISRREFWDLLYHLRREKILIIVATAYMDEAERCSKVHLINAGHFIGAGEPKILLKENNAKSFDEYFLKSAIEEQIHK